MLDLNLFCSSLSSLLKSILQIFCVCLNSSHLHEQIVIANDIFDYFVVSLLAQLVFTFYWDGGITVDLKIILQFHRFSFGNSTL